MARPGIFQLAANRVWFRSRRAIISAIRRRERRRRRHGSERRQIVPRDGDRYQHIKWRRPEYVTGPEGNYRAVALQPGPYTITAELHRICRADAHVTLTVGADTVVDLFLSMAAVQDSDTVTATAATISVAKAELSSVVLPSQIDSLPTLGRNFLELAQLLPGSAPDNSRVQYFNPTKFAGVADQRNGFTTVIDGGTVDDAIWGSTVMNFTQEAVQEFKVYRNQFDAEHGGALAAVVSVVSKSGSNTVQRIGDVYFGRDDSLNSQELFTRRNHPTHRNVPAVTSAGRSWRTDALLWRDTSKRQRYGQDHRAAPHQPVCRARKRSVSCEQHRPYGGRARRSSLERSS